MHRAKVFLTVCTGIFLLALSYHLGARNAGAQAPTDPIVALGPAVSGYNQTAVTAGGELYGTTTDGTVWVHLGNIFGTPTPVLRESFGAVKNKYRGERGTARP